MPQSVSLPHGYPSGRGLFVRNKGKQGTNRVPKSESLWSGQSCCSATQWDDAGSPVGVALCQGSGCCVNNCERAIEGALEEAAEEAHNGQLSERQDL